jgi:subtilisin family serine protease
LDWLGVPADNEDWGEGVTIALLDTRVLEHDSLGDAKVTRVDLLDDSSSAEDTQGHVGHATAIASVLVGDGEVAGVVPSAKLLGLRVLADDGTGDTFTIAQGILEAIDRGADVINLSLGTYADSPVLRAAVEAALEAGISVVAAVGNDSYAEVTYPARYDGVIAVTGVDANEQMLNFANEGLIDVAAPGYGVYTAWTDENLVSFNGTSIAAPFVAGAIAAQLAANSQLSAAEAETLVLEYVNDTGAPGPDPDYGQGILNIARIEERNVPGIFDMALAGYHVTGKDSVQISAQNRGTEAVNGVSMSVSIDGESHDFELGSLAVGETVSRELPLILADSANVDLRARVDMATETDAKSANDRRELTIENGGD